MGVPDQSGPRPQPNQFEQEATEITEVFWLCFLCFLLFKTTCYLLRFPVYKVLIDYIQLYSFRRIRTLFTDHRPPITDHRPPTTGHPWAYSFDGSF